MVLVTMHQDYTGNRGDYMPQNKIRPNMFQRAFMKGIGIEKYLEMYEQRRAEEGFKMFDSALDKEQKQLEYKVWYEGEPRELEYFFKSSGMQKLYNTYPFWKVVNTDMVRAHDSLPSAMSNAFSSLLFSDAPDFTVNTGNKNTDKKLQQKLDDIMAVNNFHSLLQEGAQVQSYSGGAAMKMNVDSNITDLPLFEIYPYDRFEVEMEYGQLLYIDFIDYYRNNKYKLVSRYGLGYINYTLYEGKSEVPLNSIPETEGLEDIAFFDEHQQLIPVRLAEAFPNKPGFKSDYEGLESSFHALDEIYSTMLDYIRRTKPVTFATEDIAPKDATGKAMKLNKFDNTLVILDGDPEGNTNLEHKVHDPEVKGYLASMDRVRASILSKASLSPATLGIDVAGANTSGEALNIRERASSRSRKEKLTIWSERLKTFMSTALIIDQIARKSTKLRDGIYQVDSSVNLDIEVKVYFPPFEKETLEQKIERYKKAIESGFVSVEYAIAKVFGNEMTDTELKMMIIQTKQQNEIALNEGEELFLQENKEFNISDYVTHN